MQEKNRPNRHEIKKLNELLDQVKGRPEAQIGKKVRFKLFVRFKPGSYKEKWSWVDWYLVENYVKKQTNFTRPTSKRIESIYLKIQECASTAEQIIVYDKGDSKNKYEQDVVLLEIVKKRVRVDIRPEEEKKLFPVSSLIN